MVVSIIDQLKELGLTEYEARAYVGLLEKYPSTAYETAQQAALPTSKIYQVMEKLLKRGMIQKIMVGERKLYIPQDPDELISAHKARMESTLGSLHKELGNIRKETDVSYIWNVEDYSRLMDKAILMVKETKKELIISAYREEFSMIAPHVKKAEKRSVNIAIVHFGKPETDMGRIYQHPIEETIYGEKGGRGFTLITDSKEALMGTVSIENRVEGAWSMNKGFVTLAEDYIKHDIYMMKIVKRFDRILLKKFGKGYGKLRNIFKDEEE